MEEVKHPFDPKTGFSPSTRIFQSLRPRVPLPLQTLPLSATEHAFFLLRNQSTSLSTPAFIDANTANSITFSNLISQTGTLSVSLQSRFGLKKGDVAFILSPPSLQIPILYFSLLSLGVIISPANPISTESEISRQITLTDPIIAFATSHTAHKLPHLLHPTILLDSPEFESFKTIQSVNVKPNKVSSNIINQSDTAAILYSSGTTGRVKGVILTHRNFIALMTGLNSVRFESGDETPPPNPVSLFTVPLFHVFGFFMCLGAVAMGETVVLLERFDFVKMLQAVEMFKVTYMPVSPPILVAMAKMDVVKKFDLSSLRIVGCGGAPLGKDLSEKFIERFPRVQIVQGYGLTESAGAVTKMISADESKKYGSAGRIVENMEAKIVDPDTGEGLPPGQRGELWIRGPSIMKGYVGDNEATASTLNSEGWLKTGDLCYIDSDGFLYVVDRLKELIKYKAYQVPPAELEHLLQSHPEIADVAVIPYPDEEAGQIPMAYIVRKPGSTLTEAQVMDFVAKQVTPYKKIRRVAFINAIPKSPAGKILRRELVELALSAPSSRL